MGGSWKGEALPGVAANLGGLAYIGAAQGRRDEALAMVVEADDIAEASGAHGVATPEVILADQELLVVSVLRPRPRSESFWASPRQRCQGDAEADKDPA